MPYTGDIKVQTFKTCVHCDKDAMPNTRECWHHHNERLDALWEARWKRFEKEPFEEGNAEDPDWPVNIIAQQRYVYRGDRLTDDPLKGMICTAVRQPNGKCITGKTGSMLVEDEQGNRHVVLRRQLRKIKETPVTQAAGQEMQEAS